VNLNDVSTVSFGRRSTVYPGLADFESLIEKDLMFSGQLRELWPERTVLGSLATHQRHSVKDHGIASAEHRLPHTLNAGHARQSASSAYSTDEYGHEISHHWGERSALDRLSPEGDRMEYVTQPLQERVLVLGEYLSCVYLVELMQ
jgi:hypothetical protein